MKKVDCSISSKMRGESEVSVACPECGVSSNHTVSAITITDPRDNVVFNGVSIGTNCLSCKCPFMILAVQAST